MSAHTNGFAGNWNAAPALQAEQILHELTEPQRQAVTHVQGPLLVLAGAGSGKTRVITRRVAYLISLGIPPNSILAITFTNKAAAEMKNRVSSLLGRPLLDFGRLDQPWPVICTFHSLGLRILRQYASQIGLPANFTVYDQSDQERLIKEATRLADLSTSNFPPSTCHSAISAAKNRLLSPEQYAQMHPRYPGPQIARVFAQYQRLLAQNNALDFDDLLLRTVLTFRQHPDILAHLQLRFQYILVDEYQDTNHAQYVMAHALALAHRNIAVVGDPDQSIYAWRGADIQNILDFEKDYPDARVIRLEQNYRSTQTILDIASELISHNRQRKRKRLFTDNPTGQPALLFFCTDEHDEARTIAEHFRHLHQENHPYSDMAVFYRVNALSRVIEDALRRAGIPYRIARGVDFYHRKEVKDVLAYLRVIVNPDDELSLARIINVPARGISDATVRRMQAHALANGWNLWQTLQNIDHVPGISPRAANSIRSFVSMVRRWQSLLACTPQAQQQTPAQRDSSSLDGAQARPAEKGPIQSIMEDVVRTSGYEAYLEKIGDPDRSELANVNELISAAAQFDSENPQASLSDYLAQVSLVSDIDLLEESGGAVTLMTLHTAKGLEFPIVAIVGMEDGLLPHSRVIDQPDQLEEERRLCFVGITRAKQHVIFSHAEMRTVRGSARPTVASRFLAEIPRNLLEIRQSSASAPSPRGQSTAGAQEVTSPSQRTRFRSGQMVRHPVFGIGRITDIAAMGQQTRAVVEFHGAGRKTLILEYARLQPLG